jgi:flagellar FliL protein
MSAPNEFRRRVRMPGKHIVAAAAVLVAVFAGFGILKDRRGTDAMSASADHGALVIPLDEFLVDLAPDAGGRIAYLKLVAAVRTPAARGARVAARIEEERAAVRERIGFLLRGLSPEDFRGADGMARVKKEMLRRVNLVIAPDAVEDVVITDLVIQ